MSLQLTSYLTVQNSTRKFVILWEIFPYPAFLFSYPKDPSSQMERGACNLNSLFIFCHPHPLSFHVLYFYLVIFSEVKQSHRSGGLKVALKRFGRNTPQFISWKAFFTAKQCLWKQLWIVWAQGFCNTLTNFASTIGSWYYCWENIH